MSEETRQFRSEVSAWVNANCPVELRTPIVSDDDKFYGGSTGSYPSDAHRRWFEALSAKGWIVPDWPERYGGAGLSPAEGKIVREEVHRVSPRVPLTSLGLSMLAPALLHFGTDDQKARFLEDMARGRVRWCQGFSEPGAGSDLASLSTRAAEAEDHLVVSGQKIWTTYADKSDWMFALVRTDSSGPKYEGITFVVFDMKSPGVTVKPIRLISGTSPFCETFLDEVKVPKDQVIGKIGEGWEVAKYLLTHEREMQSTIGSNEAPPLLGRSFGETLADEPVLRARVAEFDLRGIAFGIAHDAYQDELNAGTAHPAKSSIMKYLGTELNKQRRELMMELAGADALAWDGGGNCEVRPQAWLRSKANSIEGGTSEIQLGIVAKRILHLPSR